MITRRAHSTTRPVGLEAILAVTDDVGTAYRAMTGGGSGGGGVGSWHAEGSVRIMPQPPSSARTITIGLTAPREHHEVLTRHGWEKRRPAVDGHWEVEIQL